MSVATCRIKPQIFRIYWQRLLIENYYLIVALLYMLTFLWEGLPVGLLAGMVMCLILMGMTVRFGVKTRQQMISALVAVYVIYCNCTILFYIEDMLPVSLYVKSASNSLLPVIFFWCGVKGECFPAKKYLLAVNILGLTGVVLQFLKPFWFVQYCENYGYSYTRLSSCIGSTGMGTLTAVGAIYSLRLVATTKGKQGKITYLLTLGYILLSFQRSSWIAALFVVLIMHYYLLLKWKILKKRYFILEIFFVMWCAFLLREYIDSLAAVSLKLTKTTGMREVLSVHNMFSSRTMQWVDGLKNSNWIIGSGFGSRGHKAMTYGMPAVADGSWALLLCEIGIAGTSIFVAIIVMAFQKAIRCLRRQNSYTVLSAVCVIIIIVLQSLGSNILEFQLTTPLLWMSIGEIAATKEFRINEDTSHLPASIS